MKRAKKSLPVLGLIAILIFTLAAVIGCYKDTRTEETSTAFSVIDDRGTTLNFDEPVNTIVSLAPSNTELVFFVADSILGGLKLRMSETSHLTVVVSLFEIKLTYLRSY